MRKSFSMIELVFVVVMLGVIAGAAVMYIPQTNLQQAADYLISNIKYAKSLAQTDDRYYTISEANVANSQLKNWKAGMWQVQFHTTGSNTQNSYSIYADTGRDAATTNFDGRPMAGDSIAKSPQNKACLSGYSMTNLPDECKNNVAKETRLEETYGVTIKSVELQGDCNATKRIYFDSLGMPYCGAADSIKRLTQSAKIVLARKNQTATVCISVGGLVYGSNNGVCDK